MSLDSLEEFLNRIRSQPPQDDLVEGLIPAGPGIVILGGRPGIAKTNLALQLGFSVATGTSFLETFNTHRVKVGYLGFEGSPQKMADRLIKIKDSFPDTEGYFHFDICNPVQFQEAEPSFLKLFAGMGLVILDPLKYMVRGDYVKPSDANAFIVGVQIFSHELNAPVVLVHHVRKSNPYLLMSPGDLFEIKGAADYVEAATTVLLLEREHQKHDSSGRFTRMSPDSRMLYFPKTRDAIEDIEPMPLLFSRNKLLLIKK